MKPKEETRITEILGGLLHGVNTVVYDDCVIINKIVAHYLNGTYKDLNTIYEILQISNILYNNTSREVLPLEDGVYDMVVRKYDSETFNGAPVGAPPISFDVEKSDIGASNVVENYDEKVDIATVIDPSNMVYYQNLINNDFPNQLDYIIHDNNPIVNNQDKIVHSYPELVGTFYKCNFVTTDDAIHAGIDDDDPSVGIFERDFLGATYNMASRVTGSNIVELIAELKYDGVSVEAEILGDTIISACSRGDTANDVATDLTPIFGGYKFHRAANVNLFKNQIFGMKFECIITKSNMARLEQDHGISYKNARVAVIGILGRLDAIKFRDYLTLVPIKSSGLPFNDILMEIDFLNEHYSSGVYMRYAILQGDYMSLLSQVKKFTEEAEYMRDVMDFMYDGVVISYTHPAVIAALGRDKDKDLWSTAIKFNPMAKTAYFMGYTFTVGQDGRITPMAHFTPVEFFGTIHDKTTAHSYKRFVDLDLREGDIVLITYRNDVICYISKPDISYNQIRDAEVDPIPFPETCPFCGTKLIFSSSGDSVYCPNKTCPERLVVRTSNMLKKLGILGFRKSMIRKLGIHSLTEFLNVDLVEAAKTIGDGNAENLELAIEILFEKQWEDYRLMGAIGFTGISDARWKSILEKIPLSKILTMNDHDLEVSLRYISGIGSGMVNTILEERKLFEEDIKTIVNDLNVRLSYGNKDKGPKVRFSGIRDKELMELFRAKGFDADGDKSVTKDTYIVIVPYEGYTSNKTRTLERVNSEHYFMTPTMAREWLSKI